VIGAIDGCHINVKAPIKQADSYTNRKLGKSIILQAICTEGKLFTNISVGFILVFLNKTVFLFYKIL